MPAVRCFGTNGIATADFGLASSHVYVFRKSRELAAVSSIPRCNEVSSMASTAVVVDGVRGRNESPCSQFIEFSML